MRLKVPEVYHLGYFFVTDRWSDSVKSFVPLTLHCNCCCEAALLTEVHLMKA
jgi:hypothetical protein